MADNRGRVSIRIDEEGMLHLEVNGCEGQSCESLTDQLAQRMGTIEERIHKPEYYIENGRPDYIDTNEEE